MEYIYINVSTVIYNINYIYILESNGEITWNNSCESVLSVFIGVLEKVEVKSCSATEPRLAPQFLAPTTLHNNAQPGSMLTDLTDLTACPVLYFYVTSCHILSLSFSPALGLCMTFSL